jgi:OsmC-like protein
VREEYRWTVRVAGGPDDAATAYVRKQSFTVGTPLSFDEEEPRATAFEHLLAAVGADLVAGLGAAARRRRLALDHVEAVVEGTLKNPLTHLGVVGEEGDPGLDALAVKVFVDTAESEESVREAWQETLRRSPMAHTFRLEPELKLV